MSTLREDLSPADRLQLAYLAALAAVAAATHPHPLPLLLTIAAIAVLLVTSAFSASLTPRLRVVHDFMPIVGVIVIFNVSGVVIAAANPQRWDPTLVALDHRLFGTLPDAWMGLLGRPAWLTDLASILYASYYVIPVVMGAALYRRGLSREFDHFVFTVVATFLISYVCYFLMPAYGPRVPAHEEAVRLGGGAVSEGLRAFLAVAEVNQLDAFPSGHTALSLVFVWLGWRRFPRWRPVLVVFTAGIVFSAVYLSLHYVIDLFAGAALAALVPFIAPQLERWFDLHASSARRQGALSGRR